jgi:uncharacterized protein (DUF924 family)
MASQVLCNELWNTRKFHPHEAYLLEFGAAFQLFEDSLLPSSLSRSLETIERFGRFPQYNAHLGRPSTKAEIKYLMGLA